MIALLEGLGVDALGMNFLPELSALTEPIRFRTGHIAPEIFPI